MKVLYLSHTARVSGGERSLLDLLRDLSPGAGGAVAAPPGDLADSVRALGWTLHEIPGTDASLKLHPIFTPRAVGRLFRAALATRRIARRTGADLVHANSIRAGLIGVLASAFGGAPVVVHVRDRLPATLVSRVVLSVIRVGAAAIVANSRYTAVGLGRRCLVVHSPVDLDRFRPSANGHGPRPAGPVLGIVGQLTPWKGQDDAIRVAALLRREHPDITLLVVGSAKFVSRETRYDNTTYVTRLRRLVDTEGLTDSVRFLGEREDVPELLRGLDMLLVPSWEEPFGRVVVEALASGVPVAATSVGGPAEIFTHGEEGLLLPPRRPELWADEVGRLLARDELRAEMSRRGRARAAEFGLDAHVEAIRGVYDDVLRRHA
jgi:glycosyltransferase involved in cell wall biosynthesis